MINTNFLDRAQESEELKESEDTGSENKERGKLGDFEQKQMNQSIKLTQKTDKKIEDN